MSHISAEQETNSAELGALVAQCNALPVREICRNAGNVDTYYGLFAAFPFLFLFGAMCGIGVAVALGVPVPVHKNALGCGLIVAGGSLLCVMHYWWAFVLARKTYFAVHEKGLAYRCFLARGRYRYQEIKQIKFGPVERVMERTLFKAMSTIQPLSEEKLQRSLAETIQLHLVDGKVIEVRNMMHHFDGDETTRALTYIAEKHPTLLSMKIVAN